MKHTVPPDHGTNSRYTLGCRCDQCKEARRVYQRAYYRAHPRPPRVVPSYWSPEERAKRREEKAQREEALALAEPCIRCELRGSGYPLCTICTAELRGERAGAGMPNDLYVQNATPILVEIIRKGYPEETYVPVEHRWMMEDVHRERERFAAAIHTGAVTLDQLDAWRRSFLDFLGAILDVLPVR